MCFRIHNSTIMCISFSQWLLQRFSINGQKIYVSFYFYFRDWNDKYHACITVEALDMMDDTFSMHSLCLDIGNNSGIRVVLAFKFCSIRDAHQHRCCGYNS